MVKIDLLLMFKCLQGFVHTVRLSFLKFSPPVVLPPSQVATANPDGKKRALLIGGGIANFTDVAATFRGIIRAIREKVGLL